MKDYAQLRDMCVQNVKQTTAYDPDVGIIVMMFNRGPGLKAVALASAVDHPEQAVRMLREMADKIEKDNKLAIKVN